MTWSYTVANISEGGADRVRAEVGDTDSNDQLISDEEIAEALAVEDNVLLASAIVAEWIAATFARKADTANTEGLRVSASQRYKQFMDLADKLRTRSKKSGSLRAKMFVGGRVQSDKDTLDEDTDLVQPRFKLGMDDYESNLYADDDES